MDWLDWAVLGTLSLLLLVVAPALIGRALSPYDPDSGHPVLLSADIIAERRYLEEVARPVLDLLVRADETLSEMSSREAGGIVYVHWSTRLRDLLEGLDRSARILDTTKPPPRFITLHKQISELTLLYYSLVQEALAYFGDTNAEHWVVVRQGLSEGRPVLEALMEVVRLVSWPIGPQRHSSTPAAPVMGLRELEW